jgi:[glutamine synthetase] adenylyltransferase / [glutamine synthetase]-adenylyl-L-tyrosine phosphorylase
MDALAPRMTEALTRAERHAPYLRMLMTRLPAVTERLARGDLRGVFPDIDPALPLAQALRRAKAELALTVAIGDLAGALSLSEVMAALSAFADRALDAAVRDAVQAHVPGAEPCGLAVIALGKQGSRELSYSSDLDPILLFDPKTLPRRAREDPEEAALRIARRVVETMQARGGDGYVFRIDLRLRPSPEVTPIILPVEGAIAYYESQALPWERAAFIRARACAGDLALGQRFLDTIRPFIWRRALDFGAISEIRGLSQRIRGHYAKGQAFGPGYDLKRGRGGIRECEFFAQIHQLIHGGREPELRVAATSEALAALAAAGRIDPSEAATLTTAYQLYRTVEHRLQMVDDRQTHSLPADPDALDGVARLHGLEAGADLLALLSPHVDAVGQIYDALDGMTADAMPSEPAGLAAALEAAGFTEPAPAVQRISEWRSGRVRALRSPAALAALEAVLPQLIEALGKAHDPLLAINRLSTLIERLPSALNLFRLLEAQPALLHLLMLILIHAPTLADALAGRADLLDRLIDASAFDPPGPVEALVAEMVVDGDLEQQLDTVRRVVGDHRFALGVQVVEGASDPLLVASGYARVAEAAIQVVADATTASFAAAHGRVPGSELVILALGRMGGAELTHASDLDLIMLFSGDFTRDSDGAKPLGAVHYYNRLAQRVTAGLSVATAAGPLYEVDTRLRPTGAKGPLAVSLDGFQRYQSEEAWTWEHMALCRARVVYGSPAARAETQAIIDAVLNGPHDLDRVRADAFKMRSDMAAHKPPKGPLDVKLCAGGLVDLEFAVHVTQLTQKRGFSPNLADAIQSLVDAGLAPAALIEAHAFLTRLLVTVRLVAPDLAEPDPATATIIARACGEGEGQSANFIPLPLRERLGEGRTTSVVQKTLFGFENNSEADSIGSQTRADPSPDLSLKGRGGTDSIHPIAPADWAQLLEHLDRVRQCVSHFWAAVSVLKTGD